MTIRSLLRQPACDVDTYKFLEKFTWESGDFGEVARFIVPEAEQFMARIGPPSGTRVLDLACGTGNLALIAARRGCATFGLDIASNLLAQARERAWQESRTIEFTEGDAEATPYPDQTFDVVVSMFGVMFAPQPEVAIGELRRVTKPGGLIALANWTPDSFAGKLFTLLRHHLPVPAGYPSPLDWGDESVMQRRLNGVGGELCFARRTARLQFPFDPQTTVDFLRRAHGPTHRAFGLAGAAGNAALKRDLIELHSRHNLSTRAFQTEVLSDYLEVQLRVTPTAAEM